MCSIGIFPSLLERPYMLERLIRDTGLVRSSGKHTHLIKPGQKVITKKPSSPTRTPHNDGGAAA